MKRITISVSEAMFVSLSELASACVKSNRISPDSNTHGDLTVNSLVRMLSEDAAMVISRPGCWEASNIAQVLNSHGYRV